MAAVGAEVRAAMALEVAAAAATALREVVTSAVVAVVAEGSARLLVACINVTAAVSLHLLHGVSLPTRFTQPQPESPKGTLLPSDQKIAEGPWRGVGGDAAGEGAGAGAGAPSDGGAESRETVGGGGGGRGAASVDDEGQVGAVGGRGGGGRSGSPAHGGGKLRKIIFSIDQPHGGRGSGTDGTDVKVKRVAKDLSEHWYPRDIPPLPDDLLLPPAGAPTAGLAIGGGFPPAYEPLPQRPDQVPKQHRRKGENYKEHKALRGRWPSTDKEPAITESHDHQRRSASLRRVPEWTPDMEVEAEWSTEALVPAPAPPPPPPPPPPPKVSWSGRASMGRRVSPAGRYYYPHASRVPFLGTLQHVQKKPCATGVQPPSAAVGQSSGATASRERLQHRRTKDRRWGFAASGVTGMAGRATGSPAGSARSSHFSGTNAPGGSPLLEDEGNGEGGGRKSSPVEDAISKGGKKSARGRKRTEDMKRSTEAYIAESWDWQTHHRSGEEGSETAESPSAEEDLAENEEQPRHSRISSSATQKERRRSGSGSSVVRPVSVGTAGRPSRGSLLPPEDMMSHAAAGQGTPPGPRLSAVRSYRRSGSGTRTSLEAKRRSTRISRDPIQEEHPGNRKSTRGSSRVSRGQEELPPNEESRRSTKTANNRSQQELLGNEESKRRSTRSSSKRSHHELPDIEESRSTRSSSERSQQELPENEESKRRSTRSSSERSQQEHPDIEEPIRRSTRSSSERSQQDLPDNEESKRRSTRSSSEGSQKEHPDIEESKRRSTRSSSERSNQELPGNDESIRRSTRSSSERSQQEVPRIGESGRSSRYSKERSREELSDHAESGRINNRFSREGSQEDLVENEDSRRSSKFSNVRSQQEIPGFKESMRRRTTSPKLRSQQGLSGIDASRRSTRYSRERSQQELPGIQESERSSRFSTERSQEDIAENEESKRRSTRSSSERSQQELPDSEELVRRSTKSSKGRNQQELPRIEESRRSTRSLRERSQQEIPTNDEFRKITRFSSAASQLEPPDIDAGSRRNTRSPSERNQQEILDNEIGRKSSRFSRGKSQEDVENEESRSTRSLSRKSSRSQRELLNNEDDRRRSSRKSSREGSQEELTANEEVENVVDAAYVDYVDADGRQSVERALSFRQSKSETDEFKGDDETMIKKRSAGESQRGEIATSTSDATIRSGDLHDFEEGEEESDEAKYYAEQQKEMQSKLCGPCGGLLPATWGSTTSGRWSTMALPPTAHPSMLSSMPVTPPSSALLAAKRDTQSVCPCALDMCGREGAPIAALAREWVRFRNAEDVGSWRPRAEEGLAPDSPPMLRFVHFLQNELQRDGAAPRTCCFGQCYESTLQDQRPLPSPVFPTAEGLGTSVLAHAGSHPSASWSPTSLPASWSPTTPPPGSWPPSTSPPASWSPATPSTSWSPATPPAPRPFSAPCYSCCLGGGAGPSRSLLSGSRLGSVRPSSAGSFGEVSRRSSFRGSSVLPTLREEYPFQPAPPHPQAAPHSSWMRPPSSMLHATEEHRLRGGSDDGGRQIFAEAHDSDESDGQTPIFTFTNCQATFLHHLNSI